MTNAMKTCPKCKSVNLLLHELWKGAALVFYQSKSGIIADGLPEDVGNPYKVEAECRHCGHGWTLRGITQITDIPYYDPDSVRETK